MFWARSTPLFSSTTSAVKGILQMYNDDDDDEFKYNKNLKNTNQVRKKLNNKRGFSEILRISLK